MNIETIRKKYPSGTIIRLANMVDEQAVPSGTIGIVNKVDDMGTIHMFWENGSTLGLIEVIDEFEIVKEV